MAFFESGFVSNNEYITFKPERLREIELSVGGLYFIMFELANDSRIKIGEGALKIPARITKKEAPQSSIRPIKFSLLDPDLVKGVDVQGYFNDALYQPYSPGIQGEGQLPVLEGYFRDYTAADEIENGLQEILQGRSPVHT